MRGIFSLQSRQFMGTGVAGAPVAFTHGLPLLILRQPTRESDQARTLLPPRVFAYLVPQRRVPQSGAGQTATCP
jgi:hypothetical protein